jgi:hypothetical protein
MRLGLSSLFTKIIVTASSVCVMSIGIPTLAIATPLTESDYFLFSASTRNRQNGEKRYKTVIEVSYGNRNLPKKVWGKRGPTLRQRITLNSPKGSITLRGTGNQKITSAKVSRDPSTGRDIITIVADNARCRVGTGPQERCQAEIQVLKSKNLISDRIRASGSNGAEYDSGAQDASSTMFYQFASVAR